MMLVWPAMNMNVTPLPYSVYSFKALVFIGQVCEVIDAGEVKGQTHTHTHTWAPLTAVRLVMLERLQWNSDGGECLAEGHFEELMKSG